jgi:carboxyl-terminal processing protease
MYMINAKSRRIKIGLLIGIAVLLGTIGTGFYHNLAADSEETYKGLKIFADVIELVEKNYVDDVNTQDLVEKAIQGMVGSLDPHSALLTPEAFKELQIDTKGKFTGIGIHVTMKDGFVTVVSPIEGTPAYRAGIKAKDRIVRVDGEQTKDLPDAVKRMRGPKGTTVVVTVVREGTAEPMDFTLVRDVIPIESVKAVMLKPGYGYAWITNFREKTTLDLTQALEKMEAAPTPLKGLVLDLRDNPGGILNQAIGVSDLFLEDGTILSIKGRQKKHTKTFQAHPNQTERNYPIVVLINSGSASASEIVAGALQDHKRALLLGTTTFGKGSVQTIESMRDGYGLKFTIARYYTPSGRSIQAKGVEPDIVVAQRRLDDDKAEAASKRLTEKDLQNHLEAEPSAKPSDAPRSPTQPFTTTPPEVEFKHGNLLLEQLQADLQVLRALELLTSYEILQQLRS